MPHLSVSTATKMVRSLLPRSPITTVPRKRRRTAALVPSTITPPETKKTCRAKKAKSKQERKHQKYLRTLTGSVSPDSPPFSDPGRGELEALLSPAGSKKRSGIGAGLELNLKKRGWGQRAKLRVRGQVWNEGKERWRGRGLNKGEGRRTVPRSGQRTTDGRGPGLRWESRQDWHHNKAMKGSITSKRESM